MSAESVEHFQQVSREAGLAVDPTLSPIIREGVKDPHLSFVVVDFLKAATVAIERPSGRLPLESTPSAMAILGSLVAQLGDRYRATTETVPPPDSDVWQRHVANVRAGEIIISLPPKSWMTHDTARGQAARADYELSRTLGGEQLVLSALNYDFFNARTMANAARTLSSPPEVVTSATELEAMPWLTITNWTGAQIARNSYEQIARQPAGALHIIDMCAGTGATSASIVNRLKIAQTNGYDLGPDRLSLLAIEGTPAFYDQYVQDFLPEAHAQLAELGLNSDDAAVTQAMFDNRLHTGTAKVVEGDVTSTIKGLDFSELGPDDIVEAHANYGLHRLSTKQKEIIIESLAEAENCIVTIGDLWENCSPVNRGYFNEGYNGSLNPANRTLIEQLKRYGFTVKTVALDCKPDYIDKALLDRLEQEYGKDGRVVLAFRGSRAQEVVSLAA